MSLRLPSQNKFKPVARPGVRKAVPQSKPPAAATISQRAVPPSVPSSSSQPSTPTTATQTPQEANPTFTARLPSPRSPSATPQPLSSKPKDPAPAEVSAAASSPERAFTPKPAPLSLSLIEAASRPSVSARPSPSSSTRRAPSVPRFSRTPSVAPRARAPSVARSRATSRAPSESPLPPTPRTAGFPPMLASAPPQIDPSLLGQGMPPTLASVENRAPQSANRSEAPAIAEPLGQLSMPPPSDVVRRKAPRRRKATGSGNGKRKISDVVDDDVASQAGSTRGESTVDDDDEVSVSSSRAGSAMPSRVKRPKKSKGPRIASISLQDVEPDEMIGSPVADNITMGDLATLLLSEGRVSERGIKIDEFRRAQDARRKEASLQRTIESYKRNQMVRRKARVARNKEREKEREEIKKNGGDVMDVAADEPDSDEDFEIEPDRLTPPPEDKNGAEEETVTAKEQERDDDEMAEGSDVEEVPVNNNSRYDELEDRASQDIYSGNGGGISTPPHAPAEHEDTATAALRAAGFIVTDEGNVGSPRSDAGEWDPDDDEEPDIEAYRQQREQRIRREVERRENDQSEVVEVDDETTFINSASHSRKNKRAQRWTKDDTELFYEVLGETGENYTLMKAYFPGRDIRSLRLKGLRENKVNPQKMTAHIMARKPIDKAYLSKSAGFDPARSWDREDALFEEARADVERLKKLDSEQPLGVEGEGDDLEGEGIGLGRVEEADEEEKGRR